MRSTATASALRIYESFRRSLRLRFELHAGLVAVSELDAAGLKRVPNKRFLVPRYGRLTCDTLGTLNYQCMDLSTLSELKRFPSKQLSSLSDLSAGDHRSSYAPARLS